ncbi:MAG: hypothetical protein WCI22_02830, partial [Actinomycetota bacterium]
MGLFSKKPKPSPTDETPVGIPTSSPARSTSGSTPGSTSGTATKKAPKKGMVDPHEFAMLRAELHDVRARLDASEQAKAIVESRLAALDATTTAMATERVGLGSDDLHVRIAQLEAQVTDVSERAAQAPAFTEPPALPEPASQGPDPVLLARLDELAARVDVVAELATTPAVVAVAVAEADPETLRRLEELDQRVAAVDTLSAQITQLSARVAGQAEFGAQLSVLRDRIAELQHDTDQRGQSIIEAASAATADAELRD